MSFEVVCEACGALSGPSVGVCPFCKTVLSRPHSEITGQDSLLEMYNNGKLDISLNLASKIFQENPKARKDLSFLLLYVKILLESEGPNSLINSLLTEGLLADPKNQELLDYFEIMQARQNLKKGLNDPGEIMLKNLLRRSPDNVHAHFLLGTHLFWADNSPTTATYYLERCVKFAPNFLRAWGCLALVYKAIGNLQLSQSALRKCIELESNPNMKHFFKTELSKIN